MKFLFKKEDFIQTKIGTNMDVFSAGFKNNDFSLVKGNLKSKHDCFEKRSSERTYYILEGNAEFNIQEKTFKVKEGDLLTIPRDIGYSINGDARLLIINNPPFKPVK